MADMKGLPQGYSPDFRTKVVKPLGPIEIDRNNALAKELLTYLPLFGVNRHRDMVSGRMLIPADKNEVAYAAGKLETTGNQNGYLTVPDSNLLLQNTNTCTLFFNITVTATASSIGGLFGTRDQGSRFIQVVTENDGTTLTCVSRAGGSENLVRMNYVVGTDYNVVVVRDGTELTCYLDGQLVETSIGGNVNPYGLTGHIVVGSYFDYDVLRTPAGKFSHCGLSHRKWSSDEVKSFYDDPYQFLKPAIQPVYFSGQVVAPPTSVAVTGTAVPSQTEAEVVTGGKTIILTLTDDTWVASGATFDAERQAIINGLTSAQSELLGWNNEVRDKEVVTAVVRTSDTVATITLSASASYDITAQETITATIPASALVTSAVEVIATPTFTVETVVVGGFEPWFAQNSNVLIQVN